MTRSKHFFEVMEEIIMEQENYLVRNGVYVDYIWR